MGGKTLGSVAKWATEIAPFLIPIPGARVAKVASLGRRALPLLGGAAKFAGATAAFSLIDTLLGKIMGDITTGGQLSPDTLQMIEELKAKTAMRNQDVMTQIGVGSPGNPALQARTQMVMAQGAAPRNPLMQSGHEISAEKFGDYLGLTRPNNTGRQEDKESTAIETLLSDQLGQKIESGRLDKALEERPPSDPRMGAYKHLLPRIRSGELQ